MNLVSLTFILFLFAVLVAYYALPHRWQWMVLLAASCVFYLSFGWQYIFFVLLTAVTAFFSAIGMGKLSQRQKQRLAAEKDLTREEKSTIKKQFAKKRKAVLTATLVFNFGLLAVFKYSVFVTQQIHSVGAWFGADTPVISHIIAPIGISFYTFQTMGYLVDVYWKKYAPETNPFKTILFTSFFPQIIQGPINRFDALMGQLTQEHHFDERRFSYGCQRMLWGFFKKMAVADRLTPYMADLYANYSSYTGWQLLCGAFFYSIQIYADFSGYMDIVCGFCEILGIELAENFNRPYFSKSVAEYWRRWHITLGAWFKDYLYYPIALSKPAQKAGKRVKKKWAHLGKNLPAVFALIAVWFITGLWHGASWAYIAWGGINGFFIIFSMLFEPLYDKTKQALHIRDENRFWQGFQTIRTYLLVVLIKVFPEIGTFGDGVSFYKGIFTGLTVFPSRALLLPQQQSHDYLFLLMGVVLMFTVSMIQRKQPVRDWLHRFPIWIRWSVYIVLLLLIVFIGGGLESGGGGFMYAQF